MAKRKRNFWILILFLLCGLVIGGLIGEVTSSINGLWWLSFGQKFGLESPIILNLNFLSITFAMLIKINIASIIGMALAICIYSKI